MRMQRFANPARFVRLQRIILPIEHYRPSQRQFVLPLPPFAYPPGDQVRKVGRSWACSFQGRDIFAGKALEGKRVAFRPTRHDGVYDLYYCHQRIERIDRAVSV